MIQALVELLDRNWSALAAEPDLDFVFACYPFFERLRRDTRIAVLLRDLDRQEFESWSCFCRANQDVRTALLSLIDDLAQRSPASLPEPPTDDDDPDFSAPALRGRLTAGMTVSESGHETEHENDESRWNAVKASTSDAAIEDALSVIQEISDKPAELGRRLREVRRRWQHAQRTRRLAIQVSAGVALARVESDLRDLHPPAHQEDWRVNRQRCARTHIGGLAALVDAMFGGASQVVDEIVGGQDLGETSQSLPERQLRARVARLRLYVRRVYVELRRRLGEERSLLEIFERYRQRCQWYEIAALDGGTGHVPVRSRAQSADAPAGRAVAAGSARP
jgi:hypothetical protein